MCDLCVIENVKQQMLSRRDLFKTGAATAAVATLGAAAASPALAAGHGNVMDLTHTFSEEFPTFSGDPGLERTVLTEFAKDGYNLLQLSMNEHTGTHIDAPLHFSADGASVDEIPVADLVIPLCVVDIREKADADPDAQVTPDDLQAWINVNGDIPDKACVAMLSGWGDKAGSDAFRGANDTGLHFPGFHIEATQMLLENTGSIAIAVDTLSLDHGPSQDFATHYAWLPSGRYGIECVAGLDAAPAAGATLVVGAPKIRGGTGGQARIFALT